MSRIEIANDANYLKVIFNDENFPYLFYLYSEESERRHSYLERLERLAVAREDNLKIAKADVDENPVMAYDCSVRYPPVFWLFKPGYPHRRIDEDEIDDLEKIVNDYIPRYPYGT